MAGIVNVTAYSTEPIFTGVGHDSNFRISICFASLSLGGFPKMHYPNDNEETKGYGCNQLGSHNNKTYQSNNHLRPDNSYDELCCSDYPSSKMNKSYLWGRKNVFYLPYVNFYQISLNVYQFHVKYLLNSTCTKPSSSHNIFWDIYQIFMLNSGVWKQLWRLKNHYYTHNWSGKQDRRWTPTNPRPP